MSGDKHPSIFFVPNGGYCLYNLHIKGCILSHSLGVYLNYTRSEKFFCFFFFILNALKLKRILSSVTVSTMYGILQNLSNGTLHVCGVPESIVVILRNM